jgi:hypothetical protein
MPTSIQYSIRHLLGLTLVVAIVAAILGPMIRAWDTERQTFFAIYITVTLLAIMAGIGFACLRRLHVERVAGEAILQAGLVGTLRTRVELASIIVFWPLWIIYDWHISSFIVGDRVSDGAWWSTAFASGFVALVMSYAATPIFWGAGSRSLDFHEQGLIYGPFKFIRYSKLKHYRWCLISASKLILVGRFKTWEVRTLPEVRSEIIRLLNQHGVPHADQVTI